MTTKEEFRKIAYQLYYTNLNNDFSGKLNKNYSRDTAESLRMDGKLVILDTLPTVPISQDEWNTIDKKIDEKMRTIHNKQTEYFKKRDEYSNDKTNHKLESEVSDLKSEVRKLMEELADFARNILTEYNWPHKNVFVHMFGVIVLSDNIVWHQWLKLFMCSIPYITEAYIPNYKRRALRFQANASTEMLLLDREFKYLGKFRHITHKTLAGDFRILNSGSGNSYTDAYMYIDGVEYEVDIKTAQDNPEAYNTSATKAANLLLVYFEEIDEFWMIDRATKDKKKLDIGFYPNKIKIKDWLEV